MKIFFTLVILAIAYVDLSAQISIEIKGGYTHNLVLTDRHSGNFPQISPRAGYCFGTQTKIASLNVLTIRSGIELLQKNFYQNRTGNYAGIYQLHRNTYLQLPVSFQIKVFGIRKTELHINTGMFGGYWLIRKIEGTIPNAFNTETEVDENGQIVQHFHLSKYELNNQFSKTKDNRFEFGAIAGIQLRYFVTRSVSPVLNINYYRSFTDTQKNFMAGQVKHINQTLVLSSGILFKVK